MDLQWIRRLRPPLCNDSRKTCCTIFFSTIDWSLNIRRERRFLQFSSFKPDIQSSIKRRKKIVQRASSGRCTEEISIFEAVVDLVKKKIFSHVWRCLNFYNFRKERPPFFTCYVTWNHLWKKKQRVRDWRTEASRFRTSSSGAKILKNSLWTASAS